jgi:hypothetical protein
MKGHLKIALTLAALVVANLALDVVLVYYGSTGVPTASAVRRPPIQVGPMLARRAELGTFVCQVVLLGYWLALGDAKWYSRVITVTLLTAALGAANWAGYAMSPVPPVGGSPIWNIVAFRLCLLTSVSLAVVLIAWPLRELRAWRLTWEPESARPAARRHLHIADILLWMVPFGGLLAMVRFLAAHGLEFGPYAGRFVLLFAGVTVIAAASGLCGFLHPLQRLTRRLNYLSLFVVIGLGIMEFYMMTTQLRVRPPGTPFLPTGSPGTFGWGPTGMTTSYAVIMGLGRVNSQILRKLGCKLIGPSEEWVLGLKPPQPPAA